MIFRRGVDFMRSMSASESGCASGSASAAARRCSLVIASRPLQSCFVFIVVSPSFARLRLTRRDDANALTSQRVDDKEKPTFHHSDRQETLLGVTVAVVGPFDGEDVLEHVARHLEADAMIVPVEDGFAIIPFERFILHKILHSSGFVKRP